MGVALVQVGHRGHKPALYRFLEIDIAGIGVYDRCEFVVGKEDVVAVLKGRDNMRGSALVGRSNGRGGRKTVEPVLGRHVAKPRMVEAAMVENHVHHDFQSFAVCFIAQQAVTVVRS